MAAANPPYAAHAPRPPQRPRLQVAGPDLRDRRHVHGHARQTVVNIALPKITTVFGVGVHETQLVITSYMLALAVIMPATGYLSDTFGTKRLYLITMALFTGGSLLCGLAWNNTSLVAFRVIQGLGGGMMSPLGMTMLFKVVPPQRRNTIMGIFGLPLMLVPIGIVGILLGVGGPLVRGSSDWRGFLLSDRLQRVAAGLSTAGSTSSRLRIGAVCLVAWVWVELTSSRCSSCGCSRTAPAAANFGDGRHVWRPACWCRSFCLRRPLADRFGTRTILLVGLPLVALSMWQFSGLTMDTSDTQLRLWLAARGATMGLVMMPAMTAALNTVPAELTSRGSSLTNVMRQVFGSFGTAIFVTLLQSRQTFHASTLVQGVTSSNYSVQQTLGQVQQWVVAHGGSALQAQAEGLGAVMRQIQLTAAVRSFDDVFMVAALITLLALVPALFIGGRDAARAHDEASLVME